MASPLHKASSHTQNPSLPRSEQNVDPQEEELQKSTAVPQSPQSLSPKDQSLKRGPPVLDQDEEDNRNVVQQPGMSIELILIPERVISDVKSPTLTSPTHSRRPSKRKKGPRANFYKRKKLEKIYQTLAGNLNPIPFAPSKLLDFGKHETVLRRLGLWDFALIEFDANVRVDLVVELIVQFDSSKRCSYVNDYRINVNRTDVGRCFNLPLAKRDKGAVDEVDLDPEEFSEESLLFIEEFVLNWLLLHEDPWIIPAEISSWMRVIKDGHPEKVDWAGVFWYMMDKELKKGEELRDCYYASHFQYLIKSQREELFAVEAKVEEFEVEVKEEAEFGDENFKAGEETESRVEPNVELTLGQDFMEMEVVKNFRKDVVEEVKDMGLDAMEKEVDDGLGKDVMEKEVMNFGNDVTEKETLQYLGQDVKENDAKDLGKGNMGREEVKSLDQDVMEKESLCQDILETEEVKSLGQDVMEKESLGQDVMEKESLGQDILETEEVKNDDLMNVEEYKEEGTEKVQESKMEEIENFEECEEEEEEEEKEEEEEDGKCLLDGRNRVGEHFLRPCHLEANCSFESYEEIKQEEGEEEDDDEVEDMEDTEDGFDSAPNEDSLEKDGLTGNLLQGMEMAQLSFSTQENVREMPPDFFPSRAGNNMISGGPSFFSNGIKREIEPDHDISHHPLNASKGSRIDDLWDHTPSDFGTCVDQIQQLTVKAKMLYESKEQNYENAHLHQQYLINELQQRLSIVELVQKSKDEEITKKNAEIFRLERELYLMGNLLEGYRRSLKESHQAFLEYRQRCKLPEEPLYKDAGPGGLLLSTTELGKLRHKQEEEEKAKCVFLERKAKEFEEVCNGEFKVYLDKLIVLDSKLVGFENGVGLLKQEHARRKAEKCRDAVEEKMDVILHNVSSDATESQLVGCD